MTVPRVLACLVIGLTVGACSSTPGTDSAVGDTQTGDTHTGDTQDYSAQFAEGALPESIRDGGYIDSTFINHDGDRIYFLHSIYSPSVIAGGGSSVEACSHTQAEQLPGHVSTPGLEWNTDIYYVEWDGDVWSDPVNLGEPINSWGMECCMWLNEDETEIIFYSLSDLDNDDVDEDLGLRPTGNYRATRADRDSEWSTPVALPGEYGTEGQLANVWKTDIEKVPSGNLYLWEQNTEGDRLLVFGEMTGGTYDDPVYADPVNIDGTTNYQSQVWVNAEETRLVFNHRDASANTSLYTRERASAADPWGESITVSTTDFADGAGNNIWGEPSFDHTQNFMLMTRFDTSDAACWTPDLMVSFGDVSSGFAAPTVLN